MVTVCVAICFYNSKCRQFADVTQREVTTLPTYRPKTHAGIQAKIQQLELLAVELYATERIDWVPRLQAKIQEFNYNAFDDLGFDRTTGKYIGPPPEMVAATPPGKQTKARKIAGAKKPKSLKSNGRKNTVVEPMFADKAGNTWNGKGLMARWLKLRKDAGDDIETYRVRWPKADPRSKTMKPGAKANGAATQH